MGFFGAGLDGITMAASNSDQTADNKQLTDSFKHGHIQYNH